MRNLRYLPNVSTIAIDSKACVGCSICETVCPHTVFEIKDKKAIIIDKDGCMECGACANNCPVHALTVTPGVGCASYIIQVWLKGKENASCGCSDCC